MDSVSTSPREIDVYDDLRQAILRGEHAFGSRLKIDDVARQYGVSHMPVRKALLQLAGDGLVTTERNRGASVRSIDLDAVANIYEIVIALEAILARRAATRIDDVLLGTLWQIERELEQVGRRGDHAGVAAVNHRFHEAINARAGNPEAGKIVNRYQQLLHAFRLAYGFDARRLPGVIADHHALLTAFAVSDAEGAAAIAAGHAAKARNDMIATIRRAIPYAASKRPRRTGEEETA